MYAIVAELRCAKKWQEGKCLWAIFELIHVYLYTFVSIHSKFACLC
jgi:nicotinamide riboside transporter PnuC